MLTEPKYLSHMRQKRKMPDADNESTFSGDNVSLDTQPHSQVLDPSASSVSGWSVLRAPTNPTEIPQAGCASQLPSDLWVLITRCLRKDHAGAQMAVLAATSRHLYDLVIPILYETIIVSDYCQAKLPFGMSPIEEVDLGTCGQIFGFDGIRDAHRREARLFYASCPMTRKDFAVGYCRRMILDSAIDLAGAFLDRIGKFESNWLPPIDFDHIVEWIFTTKCLGESSECQKWQLRRIAASIRYQAGSALNATRIVLHLPDGDGTYAKFGRSSLLYDNPRGRRRREVQFEYHNVPIERGARPQSNDDTVVPGYDSLCSRVYFDPKQCAGRIDDLARWISRAFARDLTSYLLDPLLFSRFLTIQLYDVPSLFIQSSKTLADPVEAEEVIRSRLLKLIPSHIKLDVESGKVKTVARMMLDAVEFHTTKNPGAAMQYPWWRPVPVSPFIHAMS